MVETKNDKIDLKRIEQHTFHEFMIDGIVEILLGLVLIFMPILFTIPIFVVFVPFYIFYSKFIVESIRERTTYPRIGRVEFKREGDKKDYSIKKSLLVFLLFISVVFAITLVVMVVIEGKFELALVYKWIPLLFGLIMFGPSFFLIEKTGHQRYYLLGVFSTILGFLFSIPTFPDEKIGYFLYFLTLGVIAIITGIIKYIRFVRTYPVIHIEEEKQ
jgi:hypothetical protein